MVSRLAMAIGWPPMPWQRQVADVALEVDPITNEWAYSTIVLVVPRQAGKTSLDATTGVHRAITGEDRGIWYTAQKRQDARDNFMQLVKRLRRSPLGPLMKVRESNGSEGITFPTGSEYRVFAPGEDALHGKATHMVTVDEAWAFDEVAGDGLLQAIVPTFATVPGQLWIPSAAGSASSTWLAGLVDAGRMFVEQDRRDTMAFFYWGIADGVDPTDLAAIALAHPGWGYTLRPGGLLQAAATMKADEFARAYGARWTGVAGVRAIPAIVWLAGSKPGVDLPDRFALAFDVGLDDSDAAIALAWRDPNTGIAHVEIVDVRERSDWLPGRLGALHKDHDPAAIGWDRFGPAVAAGDAVVRAGVPAEPLTTDAYVSACGAFLRDLVGGRLHYTPHPALDAAVENAARRPVGDRWVWARRISTSTIAPLIAATIAVWAFDHAPPPPEPFRVR